LAHCQRNPPAKLGSITIQYKPQGEGKCTGPGLGLSAGGGLKARRKTAKAYCHP